MQLPLRLQLKVSREYLLFLASGHILAGVAVCFLRLPLWGHTCLLAVLCVSFWLAWRRARSCLPQLLLRADGQLELQYTQEPALLSKPDPDSLVWPWLVVLHLQSEAGRMRPLILFVDSVPAADEYRQLRIWLRWCAQAGEQL